MSIAPKTGVFLSPSPADPIAVFDSGVGGLSVLRALQKILPREHFLYWGDTANAPYGDRDEAKVLRLTQKAAAHLLIERHCKMLVLACNTATAVAAETLRATFHGAPIIGMEPALKPALSATSGIVWVLGTPLTLFSHRFESLIPPTCQGRVVPVPAPGMVPLIEAGKTDGPEMDRYLLALVRDLPPPDAVVLGCTHFPLAVAALRRVIGEVPFFDGAAGTAAQVTRILCAEKLQNQAPLRGILTLTATSAVGRSHLYSLYFAL